MQTKGERNHYFFPLWKPRSSLIVRLPLVGRGRSSITVSFQHISLDRAGVLIEDHKEDTLDFIKLLDFCERLGLGLG